MQNSNDKFYLDEFKHYQPGASQSDRWPTDFTGVGGLMGGQRPI